MKSFFKAFLFEALIIFLFVLSVDNYLGNENVHIKSDGIGYYDYLPSIFIHHDINRKDKPIQDNPELYKRFNIQGVYYDYKDFKLNKYPCGTSLLQFPFFTYTLLTTELENTNKDGYQKPFQKTVYLATLFYLFISLIFLRKTLELYHIRRWIIVFIQLLLVLGTSITNYANFDSSFSHVYSLFAIIAFVYFAKIFFEHKKRSAFFYACVFLGLILLIRQVNVLVIFFLPFLAGSWENFKVGFKSVIKNYKTLITGLFLFGIIGFIQLIFWYLQTGEFILYSYQSESFDLSTPEIMNVLFSYRKGLFVYTPVLFICLISIPWLVFKRKFYLVITWVLFFSIITYVISSWWYWSYGASYGLRAYIEFYPIFFIPFAYMMDRSQTNFKYVLIPLSVLTIPLNIVHTYQYKRYMLHNDEMNKEKYWNIFFQTDKRFMGLFYKRHYNYDQFDEVKRVVLGDFIFPPNSNNTIPVAKKVDIPKFSKLFMIQVRLESDFKTSNDTWVRLKVEKPDKSKSYYNYERPVINFYETELGKWHTGLYNFELNTIDIAEDVQITINIYSKKSAASLKNLEVRFLAKK